MLQSTPPAFGAMSFDGAPNEGQGERQAPLAPPILLQYWQVVLRWKLVIAGIILGSLTIGLVATLLATPQYSATSRIEIRRDQKKVTNVEGLEAADSGRDVEFYQTQYKLLESRSLAERVARKLRLANNEGFFEAHGVDITEGKLFANKAGQPLTAKERADREQLAIGLLLGHASIAPIRGSALVDIGYTSGSPVLSASIANAWAEQFIVHSMDRLARSVPDLRSIVDNLTVRGVIVQFVKESLIFTRNAGSPCTP